jgi:hypothetical protein
VGIRSSTYTAAVFDDVLSMQAGGELSADHWQGAVERKVVGWGVFVEGHHTMGLM